MTVLDLASWCHPDHLGSPVAATDSGGDPPLPGPSPPTFDSLDQMFRLRRTGCEGRESYTPFGEKLVNPNGNRDSIGYTGHIDDAATGFLATAVAFSV